MKHTMGPNSSTELTAVQPKDVQPNAVDLRLDRVFNIHSDVFEITNDTKQHRTTTELLPDEDGFFNLPIGQYEVLMENNIKVGNGEAGWIILRSSLTRNGLSIFSGLYDAGFQGLVAGVLHVSIGTARIQKGTRIAQYLSFAAETLHSYDGDYGLNADGSPKAMEAKYHK